MGRLALCSQATHRTQIWEFCALCAMSNHLLAESSHEDHVKRPHTGGQQKLRMNGNYPASVLSSKRQSASWCVRVMSHCSSQGKPGS